MSYIKKTVIVSLIFSTFLLVTLQVNKLLNKNKSDERVLGISSENIALCNLIDSLSKKYCGASIKSSTLPVTNIGSSNVNVNSSIKNVRSISSDDGKTAVITFNSSKSSIAKIEYGTTAANLVLMAIESNSTTSHKFTLTSLRSNTTYYYRIRIGNEVFTNSGIPYTFKTKQ